MSLMKPRVLAMLLSITVLIGNAMAVTNALWLAIVPPISYSNAPSSQVLSDLEAASRRLDPKGRGIRIVCDTVIAPNYSPPITIRMGAASTLDVLQMVNAMTGGGNRHIFLVDDVALLCYKWTEGASGIRYNGIYGKLVDDVSGVVITNRLAEVHPELELGGDKLQFFPDGCFFASLACDVRRPFIDNMVVCVPEDEDYVGLVVRVPGYVERRLRAPLVFDYATRPRPIEIRMTPLPQQKIRAGGGIAQSRGGDGGHLDIETNRFDSGRKVERTAGRR